MRTGKFQQNLASLTDAERASANKVIDQVSAGGNITDLATDQGMANEIKGPKHNIGGEFFGMIPGTEAWAAKMRAGIAARNAAGEQKKMPQGYEAFLGKGAPGEPHSERDFQFRENEDAGGKLDKSNIERLDPEFRARLQAMKADMPKELAEAARVNEGHRTRERQSYLWNTRSGRGMVARPGHSRHESGTAVDFDDNPARDWIEQNVGKYGLENLRGDDPHIQINRQTSAAEVEGSAKVDVNVGGGNPIRSRAHGKGLFKAVETNRSSQMPHSSDKTAGSIDSAGGEE
jgi:hypothetical protein